MDRTVLTTGANSGIGLATAMALARLGFRSACSVRSEAKAATVSEAARRAGVRLETVRLDVTDADACTAHGESTWCCRRRCETDPRASCWGPKARASILRPSQEPF